MTDLLLKPEDTGDIPRTDAVGEGTRNLAPYVRNLPPTNVLRLYFTNELPLYVPTGGCRTVVPNDEDFQRPGTPPPPRPLPAPGPPPKPSGMGEYRERRSVLYVMPQRRPFAYAGRHRPGWHGQVRRFLSAAVAPLVRSL